MNANEVIANRALEIRGKPRGSREVHPNDHVNMCQSSNDVISTALHYAARAIVERDLLPALAGLHAALAAKAKELDDVIKIGRTHLGDATPIRLETRAIQLSANVIRAFTEKCVSGIVADRARCEEMVERSLAMATAPAPVIGYARRCQDQPRSVG